MFPNKILLLRVQFRFERQFLSPRSTVLRTSCALRVVRKHTSTPLIVAGLYYSDGTG